METTTTTLTTLHQALILFIETIPLENMQIDELEFYTLYEKECEIFSLLVKMTEEELEKYRTITNLL
jgi:hypothetical protein